MAKKDLNGRFFILATLCTFRYLSIPPYSIPLPLYVIYIYEYVLPMIARDFSKNESRTRTERILETLIPRKLGICIYFSFLRVILCFTLNLTSFLSCSRFSESAILSLIFSITPSISLSTLEFQNLSTYTPTLLSILSLF
jgi:hypothetical protein